MTEAEISQHVGRNVLIAVGSGPTMNGTGTLHRRDDGLYELRQPGVNAPTSQPFDARDVRSIRPHDPG